MNICIFSPHFGGGYGVGYSAQKEVDCLVKKNHKIWVIHRENNIANYKINGVKYFYIPYNKIPILGILKLKRDLDRLVKKISSEGINLFYVNSLEFGLVKKELIEKYPVVYFARSTIKGINKNKRKDCWLDSIKKFFLNPFLIYLEKRCLRISSHILVKSTIMKKEIEALYGVNNFSISVVSGGIDAKDFPQMNEVEKNKFKKTLNLNQKEKLILFIGRISPIKGIYYLIEGFSNVVNKFEDVKLLIAGNSMMGGYERFIKRMVKNLKLDNRVVFLGYIPQEDVYKYINISDVVVLPSTYEPFGMTHIQVALLGKPLITTKSVGALEFIENYNLLKLIEPFSSQEIERALIDLIENNNLKNNRFPLDLKYLSWESMTSKLDLIFKHVAATNSTDKTI